jgi:hypothetical protein
MTLYLSNLLYSTSVPDAAGDVRAYRRVSHTCSEAGTEVLTHSKELSQLSEGHNACNGSLFPFLHLHLYSPWW